MRSYITFITSKMLNIANKEFKQPTKLDKVLRKILFLLTTKYVNKVGMLAYFARLLTFFSHNICKNKSYIF